MRRFAVELRRSIISALRFVDVEGFLIVGGIAGLAWLTWDTYVYGVPLGAALVFCSMIVGGIIFARAPRTS